ncbi:MAG: aminoacetone oxidase family FAD-binding enzyme [Patescibacteria group bacterium]|jgi:hypothetical protein
MKLAIIGGGAAGLMAAATAHAANPSAEIFLIERNDGLGKKVIISGGGRCNVTTGIFDVRTMLTRYPRGGKFLSSAMHLFPPEKVYEWFESHGVPLKIEEDLRVFPQSNDGKDIVGVFEKLFRSSSVHVLLSAYANHVEKKGAQFHIFIKGEKEPLIVDRLILTTGGQAYRHTGSTGDGYGFAIALGHTLTPLAASLNAFYTTETWPANISGLSFEKAKITAKREKNPSYTGPFLFTHKGVSGPAVFAVSSLVAFEQYDKTNPLEISINLFPDLTTEKLRELIEEKISENPKKQFANDLIGIIPKSLTEIVCEQLEIPQDKKAGEVGKKDLMRCATWLKGIPLHVIARGAGDEFVTAGGVELKDVNPSTMESKLCPGLFFAGEILDIDGFTGGFNLQASWATGHLAGEHSV